MNIKTTPFKEVFILKPTLHLDERGSFMESFNEREIEKVNEALNSGAHNYIMKPFSPRAGRDAIELMGFDIND